MSQKPKLILGTANFGLKAYGQLSEPLSMNDISFILDYARKHGISLLESSELYDCDVALGRQEFDLIYKVKHPYNLDRIMEKLGRSSLLGLLYHHGYNTFKQEVRKDARVQYNGASVYHKDQLVGTEGMIEVPLNLENREFENTVYPCKIVRSVFGRGELLKRYTVKECLNYVKHNSTIHGVIVGVDSIKQLEEICRIWNED